MNLDVFLFGGVSLELLSETTLAEIFDGENVEDTMFWKYFVKIGGENQRGSQEIKSQVTSIIERRGRVFNKEKALPVLRKMQNVFAEIIFENFEKVLGLKIRQKFQIEFSLQSDFDIFLITEELLELYKMYKCTPKNKKLAGELIWYGWMTGKCQNSLLGVMVLWGLALENSLHHHEMIISHRYYVPY